MLDTYIYGAVDRVSPEAPVPVVKVLSQTCKLGGSANVASNCRSIGCQVMLIGIRGDDEAGLKIEDLTHESGIACALSVSKATSTIQKIRILSQGQQMLRYDVESKFSNESIDATIELVKMQISNCDVVIISDYAKGTLADVDKIINIANQLNKPIIVDPKGQNYKKYRKASILTPNATEFQEVVGECYDETDFISNGLDLIKKLDLKALLVTRSEHGVLLIKKSGETFNFPAEAKEVFDVTGAGDTVVAYLACLLGINFDVKDAAEMANKAAGIAVGRSGAATISFDEVVKSNEGNDWSDKYVTQSVLKKIIDNKRQKKNKIIMTNGCFDILHPGHIMYLNKARSLGDILIVAINSDASIKNLKGANRPINNLQDRIYMLSQLSCVDYICVFDEELPEKVYELICPDVLVKGKDYEGKEISGSQPVINAGGQVILIDFKEGYSSSSIIEKIKNAQ